MSEEEIIKLIKEIFEDKVYIGKIYKIEIMKSKKIKIKYQEKFNPNLIIESVYSYRKED